MPSIFHVTCWNKPNISTEIINKTASTISQGTGGLNRLEVEDITVGGDGEFNLEQEVDIKATNEAVIQILTDTKTKTDYTTKLSTELQNKTSNDTTLNSTMKNIAGLKKSVEEEQGIGSVATKALDTLAQFSPFGNSPITDDVISKLQNNISQTINNITLNESNIKNIIKDTINSNIQNINEATCNISVTAGNQLKINNVLITESGKVSLKQTQSIQAINSCVNKIVNSTDIVNSISATQETKISNAAETKTVASLDADNTLLTDVSIKKTDAVLAFFTSPGGIICIVLTALIICCCIGGLIYYKFFYKSDDDIQSFYSNGAA